MPDREGHGLSSVGETAYEEVPLSPALGWLKGRIERFVRGGIYLIAGQPGIGKSTLGIQIALDLGRSGERSLYILTEQSTEDLARRARLMCADWPPKQTDAALRLIEPEESIYDIENLPSFLAHQVLSPGGKYSGPWARRSRYSEIPAGLRFLPTV
jgi:DNA repair protein RadA/Sms